MVKLLFLSILEITFSTSIVILAVKLLSFFLNKRYAAKWKKWIWLMIALRLMIPINFSLSKAPVQVNLPDTGITNTTWQKVQSNEGTTKVKNAAADLNTETASNIDTKAKGDTTLETVNANKPVSWMDMAILVWLIGLLVFILYQIIRYLYFRKQVLRWSRVQNEQRVQNIMMELSAKLNLKKQPPVYLCDKTVTPSLMGFVRPVLIMPSGRYSDEELTFIFKHELTHYRRHDLWYKLLLLLANAVHWFNPVIYLFRHEANIDLEISCDDEVIKDLSAEHKKFYGKMILSCINQQKMRKVELTTCFNDTTKTLKDRLQNILSTSKKRNGLIIILIILLFMIGIGTMVAFTNNGQKQKKSDKSTWYGAENQISEETKLQKELSQAVIPAASNQESAKQAKLPATMKEFLEQKLGIALEQESQIEQAVSKISFTSYTDKNEAVYGECTQKRYSFNILMNNLDIDKAMDPKEANAWIEGNSLSKKAEIILEFENLTESEAYSDYKALTVSIDYYQMDSETLLGIRINTNPASDTATQFYHLDDEMLLNLLSMLDVYQRQYDSNVNWQEFVKSKDNQELPTMLEDFITAFCQNDVEKMNQYLLKPESGYQKNSREKAEHYLEGFSQFESGNKISLSYVLYDREDGNFYLSVDLKLTDGGWRITDYALEK